MLSTLKWCSLWPYLEVHSGQWGPALAGYQGTLSCEHKAVGVGAGGASGTRRGDGCVAVEGASQGHWLEPEGSGQVERETGEAVRVGI